MQFRMIGRGRRGLALLAALGVVGVAGVRAARASDHQDNPLVELNPAMDMSDFYAFPGAAADRIVMVLNSSAASHAGADAECVVRSEHPLSVQDR